VDSDEGSLVDGRKVGLIVGAFDGEIVEIVLGLKDTDGLYDGVIVGLNEGFIEGDLEG